MRCVAISHEAAQVEARRSLCHRLFVSTCGLVLPLSSSVGLRSASAPPRRPPSTPQRGSVCRRTRRGAARAATTVVIRECQKSKHVRRSSSDGPEDLQGVACQSGHLGLIGCAGLLPRASRNCSRRSTQGRPPLAPSTRQLGAAGPRGRPSRGVTDHQILSFSDARDQPNRLWRPCATTPKGPSGSPSAPSEWAPRARLPRLGMAPHIIGGLSTGEEGL